ncbi:MAG: DNA adenine methylase [Gallionella sp.]|nr:DNA adenine methylase [Gallionella sp.]
MSEAKYPYCLPLNYRMKGYILSRFNSPLRYPGGKGKLTDFIRLIFEQNKLTDGHYVEPYAGGAGIAFSLLFLEYATHIHLNDINKSVYSFWHSVLEETDEICKLIRDCEVTMDEWYKQKSIQSNPSQHTQLELGFSTFFLNRTNRSGIIKGGVIGGKNQDGNWKLDARFVKPDLIERIKKIALYSDRISLYNQDAETFLQKVTPDLPAKTLIYLDPPYYVKGKGLYENHYAHQDHARVANLVKTITNKKWIVSYDNTPEICQFYKGLPRITYGLNYSAQNRYIGSEVMFFCPDLEIPDVENPSKLKAA